MASELPAAFEADLQKLNSLAERYGTDPAHQAIATFKQQILDLALGLSAWW